MKPREIPNWRETCQRFCDEVAEICFNSPTGEVTDPIAAFAKSSELIKEELGLPVSDFFTAIGIIIQQILRSGDSRAMTCAGLWNSTWSGFSTSSPLLLRRMVAPGVRSKEVSDHSPPYKIDPNSASFRVVALKLENELVAVNDSPVLLKILSRRAGPGKLGTSGEQTRCRNRATDIRGVLERMSLFFKLPDQQFPGWSKQRIIFFGERTELISELTITYHDLPAILYLKFGTGALGDGFIVLKNAAILDNVNQRL